MKTFKKSLQQHVCIYDREPTISVFGFWFAVIKLQIPNQNKLSLVDGNVVYLVKIHVTSLKRIHTTLIQNL